MIVVDKNKKWSFDTDNFAKVLAKIPGDHHQFILRVTPTLTTEELAALAVELEAISFRCGWYLASQHVELDAYKADAFGSDDEEWINTSRARLTTNFKFRRRGMS